jgi:predicted glycoside hydrolase/deacetylase ChbG (UPF0249 family)
MTYDTENPGCSMVHAQTCAGVTRETEFQPSFLDNWIANCNAYIHKRYKNLHKLASIENKLYTITKMNDNITMDSTI